VDVARYLPLKPRDYHILFALSREDLHGYGLMKALEEQSGGLLQLDPTSLYRRLRALLREGLVVEAEGGETGPADDPRRKYYRVTEPGLAVLRAEIRRMRELVRGAEAARLVGGA
jgi:DNA-binding PadR family transcriptional regulator